MYSVLICDDDKDIVNALKIYLTAEGYRCLTAYNGEEALKVLDEEEVHLVLMDIMMPRLNGVEATAAIREKSNIPVILLTAKSEDMDKVLGLTIGADDYVTKPFNPVELIARVKSQIRRYAHLGGMKQETKSDDKITINTITADKNSQSVQVDGENVPVTPLEFRILFLLMSNPNKVFSSKEIYNEVWNDVALGNEKTVSVHIRHLREKIEINPNEPRYIKVMWGKGYTFIKEN